MFDVEIFIEAVRGRPALYNPNHEHYNRKEIRVRLWDEIGHVMFPNWTCLEERDKRGKALLMQKKWKSLKDCFNRELRLRKVQHPNKVRKQYEFYNRLSFLLNKQNPEPPQQMHDPDEVMIKTETSQDVHTSNPLAFGRALLHSPQPPHSQEHPRKKKVPEVEVLRDARGKQDKRPEGGEDSDRLFLMSFVNDLSILPLSTKYWVKMKFSEIMHQATMSLDGFQEADYKDESCEDKNGGIDCMS